jgi:hypothetical protein
MSKEITQVIEVTLGFLLGGFFRGFSKVSWISFFLVFECVDAVMIISLLMNPLSSTYDGITVDSK